MGSSFTSSSTQVTPSSSNFLAVVGPNPEREVNFVVPALSNSFFFGFGSFLTGSFLGAGAFLAALAGFLITTFSTAFFSGFETSGLKGVFFFSLALYGFFFYLFYQYLLTF